VLTAVTAGERRHGEADPTAALIVGLAGLTDDRIGKSQIGRAGKVLGPSVAKVGASKVVDAT
jgi:hypothetical protein